LALLGQKRGGADCYHIGGLVAFAGGKHCSLEDDLANATTMTVYCYYCWILVTMAEEDLEEVGKELLIPVAMTESFVCSSCSYTFSTNLNCFYVHSGLLPLFFLGYFSSTAQCQIELRTYRPFRIATTQGGLQ